jgi:hypothetical protein
MQEAMHVVFPDALVNQAAAARGIGIACRHTAHKLPNLVKNIVYQFTYLHRNPKKITLESRIQRWPKSRL